MIPRVVLIIIAIVAFGILLFFLLTNDKEAGVTVNSYEECAAMAGSVIMESYPEQCRTVGGQVFVNDAAEPIPVEPDGGIGVAEQFVGEGCIVSGCSGQLCVGEETGGVASTCEFRESYTCYRTARCERQPEGDCGWSLTPELTTCLDEKSHLDFVPVQQSF